MIDVKAIIFEFNPDVSHDSYADGSFAVFDAVKLKVLEPEKMKDRILTVLIKRQDADDSFWKQLNATVIFSIDESFLGSSKLYGGALENVRRK